MGPKKRGRTKSKKEKKGFLTSQTPKTIPLPLPLAHRIRERQPRRSVPPLRPLMHMRRRPRRGLIPAPKSLQHDTITNEIPLRVNPEVVRRAAAG